MPAKKTDTDEAIVITHDGVWIAEDERKDEGDQCRVSHKLAELLIERGHAKRI